MKISPLSVNTLKNVHNCHLKKANKSNENFYNKNLSFPTYYTYISFKGEDNSAYTQLQKSLKAANYYLSQNGRDLRRICTADCFINSGQNSRVYRFPEPSMKDYVLKLIVRDKNYEESFNHPLKREKDVFPGLDKGQTIAKVGEQIEIMKYIPGEAHSIPNWSFRRNVLSQQPITNAEATKFLDSIVEISEFPQESFDKYAKELNDFTKMNYKADSFNPNNYLVDYDKKEIHIIDAYKYKNDGTMNTKYDLICPLIDYPNFENYYNVMSEQQKEQYIETTKTIAEKCTIAAQNIGINTSEKTFTDFISIVDGRYNFDVYTKSFQQVKEICGDI